MTWKVDMANFGKNKKRNSIGSSMFYKCHYTNFFFFNFKKIPLLCFWKQKYEMLRNGKRQKSKVGIWRSKFGRHVGGVGGKVLFLEGSNFFKN